MSHIIEEKKRLDEESGKKYNALYKKLEGLIEYVSSQLPEGAEETLHELSADLGVLKIDEHYILTRDGAFEMVINQEGSDKPKLFPKKLEHPLELVVGSYFENVCNGLQRIIDKYKIEIPETLT